MITGLGLIVFGLLTSVFFQFILVPCTTNASFIKNSPEFPVYGQYFDIDTTLYQPKSAYDIYGNERPAVVLVHGFASSKVYFHDLAEELTKRGFVCLAITANGHSASSGAFTLTWENVTLSAVKYLRDYSSALRIDTNRIGLVGHSLGAFSVLIASIMDQKMGNNWINATIGIGGPALNITNSGLYRIISDEYIYPHLWFNLSTALEIAILKGKMNITCPYNFLNIIGDKDEMFSLKDAYQFVYGSSTPDFWTAYGISNYSMILPGTRYSDFNGTARKLVVLSGVDHLLEGSDTETISETVDWFEESMKLKGEGTYPGPLDPSIILGGIRETIVLVAVIGSLISVIAFVKFYGNLLRPKMIFPKNAIRITRRSKWKMILLYGGSFIGISFTTFLFIDLLSLEDFLSTDFLGANLLTLPFLIQGTLMVPVIITFMWYEKKKFHMELSDFGITRSFRSYIKAAIYGILLFLTLYTFLNMLSSTGLQNLYIWRIFGFLQVFLYIFLGMITFEILFRGMVQNKFYGHNMPAWKEIIQSGLISGIIEGLGLGLIIISLLTSIHLDIFPFLFGHSPTIIEAPSFSFSEQFLLIPIIIAIEIIFSLLRASIYRKMNRNFLASTLFSALFIAWVLVSFLPSTTLLTFRLVFMT
jgi:pimeloyl-ACP methyl ester carboxylesterase